MTSFRRVLTAAFVSNLGDGILVVSLPLMAASVTRDPRLVAGVAVAGQLPWLLFALVSGAMVDRVDRRRAMVATDLVRGFLVALLALELAFGPSSLAVLYVVAFALGAGETVFDSAAEAFLPAVVPSEDLERANGRLEVSTWVSNDFLGPILGGGLYVALTWAPAAVDAASFLVAASVVASIRGDFRARRARERVSAEIAGGIRWLWSHRALRGLAAMSGGINLLAGGVVAVFVLYAQDELGVSGSGYGVLFAALGVGGGVGALAAGTVVGTFGQVWAIRLSLIGFIAASTVLALTTSAIVAGAMISVYGACVTLWRVVVVSIRQRLTPDEMRGRIAGATRLIAWGTRPVGALLGGIVAGAFGLRAPFLLAIGVFVVALAAAGAVALGPGRCVFDDPAVVCERSFVWRRLAVKAWSTLAEFESFLDAGGIVEPVDGMPEEYRDEVFRFIEMHANSELMGGLTERDYVPRAPGMQRKLGTLAKTQDEIGHAHLLYMVAADLGIKTRDQMLEDLYAGRTRFHNVFHYRVHTWADQVAIAYMIDAAALTTQQAVFRDCSYGPYRRVLRRIIAEEGFHMRQGEEMLLRMADGTARQHAMFQEAVDRWWLPAMHFFGPPSSSNDVLLRWHIKSATNEELRDRYVQKFVPQLIAYGFTIPDPDMRYDEEQRRWLIGDIDWSGLQQTQRNTGPDSERRIATARSGWESASWVREALDAAAAKLEAPAA